MTPPRLEACYFLPSRQEEAEIWRRLARVLERSAAEHCAAWDVRIRQLPPAPRPPWNGTCSSSFIGNTVKLEHWAMLIAEAEDGDRVLLMDADTLVRQSLDSIWSEPFDLAYTVRPPICRFPLNAGVVFARVSPGVRRFFTRWVQQNRLVLGNTYAMQPWRRRFGGLNQAALGKLLAEGDAEGLDLRELPCLEWNCEDSTWAAFDPAVTRIVHIKSALRFAIVQGGQVPAGAGPLVAEWRARDGQQDREGHP